MTGSVSPRLAPLKRPANAAATLSAARKFKHTEETDMTMPRATTGPSGAGHGISPPSSDMGRVLGGITVPDTPVIALALERARSESEDYLFNHAVRSWLFAARTAQLKSAPHDGEVLAVTCLLHDLTLTKDFKGPRRFEVEAADIARAFVREQGFDDRRAQLVWDG